MVTAAGFLRRIDPRDESVMLWIWKHTDEGRGFLMFKMQQTKIKSQMMVVENRATSSTEGLGGANHSTTLRSISFTFHIRQNGDKLRVTKAKQWPRWSTLTEEGKYGVPLLRFNRVLLPAGANVSRRVKSRPVESRQGHVCISDCASPSPLFHAQSWSS